MNKLVLLIAYCQAITSVVPCGDATSMYNIGDQALICLFFPSLNQKVVFYPAVDTFETL